MEDKELLTLVEGKAQQWIAGNYDEATKQEVSKLVAASDKTDLIEAFYKDLEFGTGGLRGIMHPDEFAATAADNPCRKVAENAAVNILFAVHLHRIHHNGDARRGNDNL